MIDLPGIVLQRLGSLPTLEMIAVAAPGADEVRVQTIQGCIYGKIRPAYDLPLFADWYMSGELQLDEMHTTSLRLEDVPDVFANPNVDRGIRPIIEFPL